MVAAKVFGVWVACADGRAHYALSGRRLCGARATGTGKPVRASEPPGRFPILGPYCAACLSANERRWAGEGR
jgi:hypothetical protein